MAPSKPSIRMLEARESLAQLYMGLASEGYEMSYRRIPLSRERTPEAADLDTLHSQLQYQPPGAGLVASLPPGRCCPASVKPAAA